MSDPENEDLANKLKGTNLQGAPITKAGSTGTNLPTQNTDENQSSQVAATQAKQLQLQPFWQRKPLNWFRLAEIQFDLQGIKTEKAKYQHVLATLSPETCEVLSDFLINPPAINQYTALKEILLDRLAPSDEKQLEILLSQQSIGDRRPSEALRHIRTLAGSNFSDKIIRSMWIRCMPEVIRIALLAQPESFAIELLAKTADKLHNAMDASQQQVHQVETGQQRQARPTQRAQTNPNSNRSYTPGGTLEERLSRIESGLNILFRRRSHSRGSNRSRSRNSSASPGSINRRQGRCWYHAKFGSAAKRGVNPCNYQNSHPPTSTAIQGMDIESNSSNQKNL